MASLGVSSVLRTVTQQVWMYRYYLNYDEDSSSSSSSHLDGIVTDVLHRSMSDESLPHPAPHNVPPREEAPPVAETKPELATSTERDGQDGSYYYYSDGSETDIDSEAGDNAEEENYTTGDSTIFGKETNNSSAVMMPTFKVPDFVMSRESDAPPRPPLKIGIYMTTHQSASHMDFIKNCWPFATKKLTLLQQSDLLYYTSAPWDSIPHDLLKSMGFKNVTIYQYKEQKLNITKPRPVYKHVVKKRSKETPVNQQEIDNYAAMARGKRQFGAKLAMVDPYINHWFDDYDWIIRLNPDVLIRKDHWLLAQMNQDHVQAILYRYGSAAFHSDFYAFRPRVYTSQPHITPERLQSQLVDNNFAAERQMMDIFGPLLKLQNDSDVRAKNPIAWLPGVSIQPSRARMIGPKSHVLHVHHLSKFCPNYFEARDGEWFR
jgi:hypothetical protein